MASSYAEDRVPPDGFVPEHALSILNDWKPYKLSVDTVPAPMGRAPKKAKTTSKMVLATRTRSRMLTSTASMPPPASAINISGVTTTPRQPSHTAASSNCNTVRASTKTRGAQFYDKHLAKHLTLETVRPLDSLVADLARTVDSAIWEAYEKRKLTENPSLPPNGSRGLKSPTDIAELEQDCRTDLLREAGVEVRYDRITRVACLPIAAVLAVHPLIPDNWRATVLDWTREVKPSRCAIPDGALHFRKPPHESHPAHEAFRNIWPHIDSRILPHVKELSESTLATWEMKSLTVGHVDVFNAIRAMRDFNWQECREPPQTCKRAGHADMHLGPDEWARGHDALLPFWTPPAEAGSPRNVAPLPTRHSAGIEPVSVAPVYSAGPSKLTKSLRADPSSSSLIGMSQQSVEDVGTPMTSRTRKNQKRKHQADSGPERNDDDDARRKDPPNVVAARSLLQQAWAQTVFAGNTILVLHSGNHEIIGVRHRASQTLYISGIIEPWNCQRPGYGKIQVGIYIAAIRDAVDRLEQGKAQPPSKMGGQNTQTTANGPAPDSQYEEDDRRPTKKPRRGDGQGKKEGGAADSGQGVSGTKVALAQKTAASHFALIHFRYDVFFSPKPATFVRKSTRGANIPDDCENCLIIVLDAEMEPGSTGIVHTGTMDVFDEKIPIAVKLAFSEDDKSRLAHEYSIYSHLQPKNVPGIPQVFGLFVDAELIYGYEGPHALITSFAGSALDGLPNKIPLVTKISLVTTLQKVHEAGVIHGDISLANICIDDSQEAFIIDFTHAHRSNHPRAQAFEMEELHALLEIEMSTTQANRKTTAVDITTLRRSDRIKKLKQDDEAAKAAANKAATSAKKETLLGKTKAPSKTKNTRSKAKRPDAAQRGDANKEAARKSAKEVAVARRAARASRAKTLSSPPRSGRRSRPKDH